jgi:hypothetical protein
VASLIILDVFEEAGVRCDQDGVLALAEVDHIRIVRSMWAQSTFGRGSRVARKVLPEAWAEVVVDDERLLLIAHGICAILLQNSERKAKITSVFRALIAAAPRTLFLGKWVGGCGMAEAKP